MLEVFPSLAEVEAELSHRQLLNFIPKASKGYVAPIHLAPLLAKFEAAIAGQPQRVVCHAPPRHGKSEAALHVPAFALRRHPGLVFSYSTYADRLSRSKSRKARNIAEAVGVRLASSTLNEWRTPEGGGMLAGGVDGPLTGHGVNIALIDDPIENRLKAESAVFRDRLGDWYHDVLRTRIEPGGSIFLFATRWHPDDLSARLIKEGFEYLCLPALNDSDEALWPERWPAAALQSLREEVGPYTWDSLYQGAPRPRGGRVFGDPWSYQLAGFPEAARRFSIGLDLSYSAKKQNDWSVAMLMAEANGYYWVRNVVRKQCRAPEFVDEVRRLWLEGGRCPIRWYAPGPEIGIADFFNKDGVPVTALPARGDKFIRAQPYAAKWNSGRVLLPEGAPWLNDFVTEHTNFTGLDGQRDDTVDAGVAAYDQLAGGVGYGAEPKWPKTTRRG